MFDFFKNFFHRFRKKDIMQLNSGEAAKERLNLVLMQDRANVSADYIDLMRQDIIQDIKKYIDVDEKEIDLKLTNQIKNDGSNGIPALYANIPINRIKNENKAQNIVEEKNVKKDEIKNSIINFAGNKSAKSEEKNSIQIVEKNEKTENKKTKKKTETKDSDEKVDEKKLCAIKENDAKKNTTKGTSTKKKEVTKKSVSKADVPKTTAKKKTK